jgi:hypothetical protein
MEPEIPEPRGDDGYSAFQKWEFKPFISVLKDEKVWIDYTESFYRATELLFQCLAVGKGFPDIEGIAAMFLFRHYLELILKRIVVRGRHLKTPSENAFREEVEQVANIHDLRVLWNFVLRDAKPKIADDTWEDYDIAFVEKCIFEFDERDKKGFAFRYPRQGGEKYQYDFGWLCVASEHVQQVLANMVTYLIEEHRENQDAGGMQSNF